jgi:carboxyl-terminal processing protease
MGLSLLLLQLSLLVAIDVQAELTCKDFHALIDYVKKNHVDKFSPDEYLLHYTLGLVNAADVFSADGESFDPDTFNRLTTPDLSDEGYASCADSEQLLAALKANHHEDVTLGEVLDQQAKGLVAAMDPHSRYYTTNEWNGLSASKESASLGVRIAEAKPFPRVAVVYPGGPAEGILQEGDELVAVRPAFADKAIALKQLNQDEVLQALVGEAGDQFAFQVRRAGQLLNLHLNMENEAGSAVLQADVTDDGFGYIRLADFHEGAAEDIETAIKNIEQNGARTIALDLRNNPGGFVNEAVQILDLFLDRGVAVNFQNQDGDILPQRMIHPGMVTDMPMVVLINRNSASAAELTPLALRDFQRAGLVGEPTFGKGTAQIFLSPETLQDEISNHACDGKLLLNATCEVTSAASVDGALRLTSYRYFGPKGDSVQRKRLLPDIIVKDDQAERQEIEKKRQQSVKTAFIAAESDYPNALSESSIDVDFDPGTAPNNHIRLLLDQILPLAVSIGLKPIDDAPLMRAKEVLGIYRQQCLSYHENQCDFVHPAGSIASVTP